LLGSLGNHKLRPAIDIILEGRSMLQLARSNWWWLFRKDNMTKDFDAIHRLNELTSCRLRLYDANINPSRNNGLALLMSKIHNNSGFGCTATRRLRADRRLRESFLFATQNSLYEKFIPIIDHKSSLSGLDTLLIKMKIEANDTDHMRLYFSYAKTLVSILDRDAAKGLEQFWSQLEPVEMPPFEPISTEDLERAHLAPKTRRSAETTKKAKRQSATGS
jgi:hypothetical protein